VVIGVADIQYSVGIEYRATEASRASHAATGRRPTVYFGSPAEIFGMDGIIVLIVVVLVLFGSTQIPKLARSLGSAQKEFKKGVHEGASEAGDVVKTTIPTVTVVAGQPHEIVAIPATEEPAAGIPV
jgi:sec-independent protein translocase protein TatA